MENISNKSINDFKKFGFIHLKNFLSHSEVQTINEYRENIVTKKLRDLYSINKQKLAKSNLKNAPKNILLEDLKNNPEIKFKNFNNLKKYFLKKNIISETSLDIDKNLEFDLHIAFANSEEANYKDDCDILLNDIISKIFLKDDLIKIYQTLLNEQKLLYWGESGFTYNKPPIRGWHSDDPINTRFKTNDETFQIRVGIFPDSKNNQSGGLKILPTSHKYNTPLQALKNYIKYFFFKIEDCKNTYKSINLLQFQKNIFPSNGDIIIWDKRLMHSPWAGMLKFLNFGCLPPKIENYLPKTFFVSPSFPRSILSFDLGKKSTGLNNYLNKWINIRHDYKEYWKSRDEFKKKEYMDFLDKKNIEYHNIKV
tara:strand:- start:47 stop:1147 length:1101 start_codon:yes stop_codon:yes gene_type:complete